PPPHSSHISFSVFPPPPTCTLFPYTTLFRSSVIADVVHCSGKFAGLTVERSNRRLSSVRQPGEYRNLRMGHSVGHQNLFPLAVVDRKSTRLNSSHQIISYAVFCLKKKKKEAH